MSKVDDARLGLTVSERLLHLGEQRLKPAKGARVALQGSPSARFFMRDQSSPARTHADPNELDLAERAEVAPLLQVPIGSIKCTSQILAKQSVGDADARAHQMCRRMEANGVTPMPPATRTATSAEKTSSAGAA
jgi:hypothetical protein